MTPKETRMAGSDQLPTSLPKLVGQPDRGQFAPAPPPPVYDNRPQANGPLNGALPPRHVQTGRFLPKG
jgi:hypothetical protein